MEKRLESKPNAFDLFGLDLDADRKGVRRAWAELSREFHPDRLAGLERPDLHPRVETVFSALSEAYATLSDKSSREKLRTVISAGGKAGLGNAEHEAARLIQNAFEAEVLARDAEKLVAKGHFERALPMLRKSLELDPGQFQVRASLEWAVYNTGSKSPTEGRACASALEALLRTHDNCTRAGYYAGLIYLQLGDKVLARRFLEMTLKLEPGNIGAARQLRALDHSPTPKAEEKPRKGLRNMFGRR